VTLEGKPGLVFDRSLFFILEKESSELQLFITISQNTSEQKEDHYFSFAKKEWVDIQGEAGGKR